MEPETIDRDIKREKEQEIRSYRKMHIISRKSRESVGRRTIKKETEWEEIKCVCICMCA